jgi:hypothetical protein
MSENFWVTQIRGTSLHYMTTSSFSPVSQQLFHQAQYWRISSQKIGEKIMCGILINADPEKYDIGKFQGEQ